LVGPNAVGKSNVIDALRFLRDAVVHSLDHAISDRGGIEVIRQYSPTRPFKVSFRIGFQDEQLNPGHYELKIESLGSGNYRVEREEISWFDEEAHPADAEDPATQEEDRDLLPRKRLISRDGKGKVTEHGTQRVRQIPADELFLGSRGAFLTYPVTSMFSGLRFSALYPNVLRQPNRPDTDKRLKETGDNWASVLKALRQNARGKQALQSILEMMQKVMPSLTDVKVRSVGAYLVPQFFVKDSPSGKEHGFDPVQLSDGTLRIFGILLGLYQLPSPKFLALEEPELTVNAGVLAVLADAFKEVAQRTQLIVTSHSPNLVDYFAPEQIRVVWMKRGETRVSPIRKAQLSALKQHLTTLQELMMFDGLQPEEEAQ
jgi:predicted ATPase